MSPLLVDNDELAMQNRIELSLAIGPLWFLPGNESDFVHADEEGWPEWAKRVIPTLTAEDVATLRNEKLPQWLAPSQYGWPPRYYQWALEELRHQLFGTERE